MNLIVAKLLFIEGPNVIVLVLDNLRHIGLDRSVDIRFHRPDCAGKADGRLGNIIGAEQIFRAIDCPFKEQRLAFKVGCIEVRERGGGLLGSGVDADEHAGHVFEVFQRCVLGQVRLVPDV